MRLWTLHPKYFDTKGLLASWREALLAKHVLEEKTRGYKNHPQLIRFKKHPEPVKAINYYLQELYLEALSRNYRFDNSKFQEVNPENFIKIQTTTGQVQYELEHLKKKLALRDTERLKLLIGLSAPEIHPLFEMIEGKIEDWEKTGDVIPG